jgi:hypothetical protein
MHCSKILEQSFIEKTYQPSAFAEGTLFRILLWPIVRVKPMIAAEAQSGRGLFRKGMAITPD